MRYKQLENIDSTQHVAVFDASGTIPLEGLGETSCYDVKGKDLEAVALMMQKMDVDRPFIYGFEENAAEYLTEATGVSVAVLEVS